VAKFRSKPVEIEAEQYHGNFTGSPRWLGAMFEEGLIKPGERNEAGATLILETANGPAVCSIGDWIIREPTTRGCYPCKPDVFAAKYEPA
jgi:hypothetical protein